MTRRAAIGAEVLFGRPPFDRLAHTHGFIAAADAFFGISLAGSLFFNVSLDAARPRIVLYLLVTMAPFAVVAPLIGPFVDRLPGGQRALIAVTCAGRAIVCLNLAGELRTLLFYPLAFTILVLGKTYSVAKNTLVPRLVGDPDTLVEANSLLSRVATYAGAVAALTGLAVLKAADAGWALRAGAILYLAAAGLALRLPRPLAAAGVPRALERRELRATGLRAAASAMGTLRAAVGFVVFLLAVGLKRSGDPTWFFGAVFAAHAAGGFAGTFVAPRVRRAVSEDRLLLWALTLVSAACLSASLGPGRIAVVVVAIVVGTSANVGRQAFDSLVQRGAPDVERGRLFARFETRFQLSWVLGALVAVATQPPVWAGFVVVGSASALAALSYLGVRRASPAAWLTRRPAPASVPAGEAADSPAARLLAAAEALATRGEHDAAVVVASASVDAAVRAVALGEPSAEVEPRHLDVADELQRLRRKELDGTVPSAETAARALELASSVVRPVRRARPET